MCWSMTRQGEAEGIALIKAEFFEKRLNDTWNSTNHSRKDINELLNNTYSAENTKVCC